MKRLLFTLTVLVLLSLSLPLPVLAATEWIEDFTTNTRVDLTRSDARIFIAPANGFAELPAASRVGALQLRGMDQVLLTSQGIEYFSFDGTTMIRNPLLSSPRLGTGIAIRQDSHVVWVATDREVLRLEYTGMGMTENPLMSVTGRRNIINISSQPVGDELALLSRTETGQGFIEMFQAAGGTMQTLVSFRADTVPGNPVDIAIVPGTMDIIYATENAVMYFHFDPGTTSFVQNPMLSVTGLTGVTALRYHDGGFALLRAGQKERFMFTGTEMARVDALTHAVPAGTVSLALDPGSYDFAVLDETGRTHYFNYTDTGYALNPQLSAQGAPIPLRHYTPRRYVSQPITFMPESRRFLLSAVKTTPPGTSVRYFLLVGSTETEIIPGVALSLPVAPASVVLIAELATTEPANTPRITRLHLQAVTLGLDALSIVPFPLHPDFAHLQAPISVYPAFPPGFPAAYSPDGRQLVQAIPVQRGGAVAFEARVFGAPEQVTLMLTRRDSPIAPLQPLSLPMSHAIGDLWSAVLPVPAGQAIDTEYWLSGIAMSRGAMAVTYPGTGYMHNPFLIVVDDPRMNILNVHLSN
jgi:hypothetical protein